jgi:hypothetical protein
MTPEHAVTRWAVVDVRVFEVDGPTSEAEAIASVREQPDLEPASRDTSAEQLTPATSARLGREPGP